MRVKLSWLETLGEVVRLGSFTRAAHQLHLSQPAVSLHVRELEQAIGQPLIERMGRRAVATPAGEIVAAHAARVLAELDAAEHALRALHGVISGRVRLGTGATASIHLLPPVFRRLRERHPQLEIRVSTGNTPDMVRDLLDGQLDLGLLTAPVPRALHAVTVYRDQLVATLPAGHRLRTRAALRAADLAREALILYPAGSGIRNVIDHWLGRTAASSRSVMEVGSAEAIKKLVEAGLGVSLLSHVAVRTEAARGELQVLALRPALSRRLVLVRRRDKPPSAALDAVQRAIRDHLGTAAGDNVSRR